MLLLEKEHRLEGILSRYKHVAVAFSGGADSSLLAGKALDVLGRENVLLLTARSCLLKQAELDNAATWLARHSLENVRHEFFDLEPLAWTEFTRNTPDRCYICKLRVYKLFAEAAARQGITDIIDGANDDDMHSVRPGLRALRELGVGTPLAEAGLTKNEVRLLSRELQLDTWDRPSSSCLATRMPVGVEITPERIGFVHGLESCLERMGFTGCRVRPDRCDDTLVSIEVREKDIWAIASDEKRMKLAEFFNDFGVKRIFLDLRGR